MRKILTLLFVTVGLIFSMHMSASAETTQKDGSIDKLSTEIEGQLKVALKDAYPDHPEYLEQVDDAYSLQRLYPDFVYLCKDGTPLSQCVEMEIIYLPVTKEKIVLFALTEDGKTVRYLGDMEGAGAEKYRINKDDITDSFETLGKINNDKGVQYYISEYIGAILCVARVNDCDYVMPISTDIVEKPFESGKMYEWKEFLEKSYSVYGIEAEKVTKTQEDNMSNGGPVPSALTDNTATNLNGRWYVLGGIAILGVVLGLGWYGYYRKNDL